MSTAPVSSLSSSRERERRYAALRQAMQQKGLGALIVCSRGDVFTRGRIQYVSDIFQWGGTGFVILPLKGASVFVGHPVWDLARASIPGWVTDLRMPESAGAEIAAILSDAGLSNETVGIVGLAELMPIADFHSITASLPKATFLDATDLFDDIRAIKSGEELEKLREISTILRVVFKALEAEIRPGITERHILAQAYRLCRQFGCTDGIALIGRVPFRSFNPGSPDIIKKTDTIVVDLEWGGPSHYWLELRRCFSFGEPPDIVRRYWETRVESFAACVDVMRAGNSSDDILTARDRVYAKHGQTAQGIINYSAHGIGIDSLEPPLVPGKERTLKENMVLNLHPNIGFPGQGSEGALGVSIGDNVLVGKDRGIRLTDKTDEWVVLHG